MEQEQPSASGSRRSWRERLNQPVFARRGPREADRPAAAETPCPPAALAAGSSRLAVPPPPPPSTPPAATVTAVGQAAYEVLPAASGGPPTAPQAAATPLPAYDLSDPTARLEQLAAAAPARQAIDALAAEEQRRVAEARAAAEAAQAARLRAESLDVADRLAMVAQRAGEHRPAMEQAVQRAREAEAQLAAERREQARAREAALRAESLDAADRLAARAQMIAPPQWEPVERS